MTCKDCVHYEPCFSGGVSVWNNIEQTEDDHCKHFKNKADFVEVKWISVKGELPKEKERVLVFLKNNGHTKGYTRIDTDRLIKGSWIRWGSCVTHWMPLPEPPKKEGADNG